MSSSRGFIIGVASVATALVISNYFKSPNPTMVYKPAEAVYELHSYKNTSPTLPIPASGVQIHIPPETSTPKAIPIQPPASPRMQKFHRFSKLLPQYHPLFDKSAEELTDEGYEVKVDPLEKSPVRIRVGGAPYKEIIVMRKRIDNRIIELGLTRSKELSIHLRERTLKEENPSNIDDIVHFYDYGAKLYLDTAYIDGIGIQQYKKEFNDHTLTIKDLKKAFFGISKYRLLEKDEICRSFRPMPFPDKLQDRFSIFADLHIPGLGYVLPVEIPEDAETIFCGVGQAHWSKHEKPVTLGIFNGKYPELSLQLKADLAKEEGRYEPLLEELLD